jgi:hypothetical protein
MIGPKEKHMSATTTTRPRDEVNGNPTVAPTGKLSEADSHFIASSSGRSYAEDRKIRERWGRFVRFAIFIPIWVLSVIPLAREISGGREGAVVVLAYLAVGAISLGIALAIRGVYYVLTMKKQFLAPLVFLVAAVLPLAGYAVQTAGYEEAPIAAAAAHESEAGR